MTRTRGRFHIVGWWLAAFCLLLGYAGCDASSDTVTVSLKATPAVVAPGGATTLTWTSRSAAFVASSNFGAATLNGSLVVTPAATTTYTITVGAGDTRALASATVTLLVMPPAPQPGATPADPFYVQTANYFTTQSSPFAPASQFADRDYPVPLGYAAGGAPPAFLLPDESERSIRLWAQADPRLAVISGVAAGAERVKVFLVPSISYSGQNNIIGLTRLFSGSTPYYEVYVATLDPKTEQVRPLRELQKTLAHELGHVFGLGHSPDERDLMYYRTNGRQGAGPDAFLTLGDALTLWTTLTARLIPWVPGRPPVTPAARSVQPLPAGRMTVPDTGGTVICVYRR